MDYGIAIETKYQGPTNTKGARIVAVSMFQGERVRTTLDYDHAANGEANHEAAARKLLRRASPNPRKLVGVGESPTGRGYVFIAVRDLPAEV